MLHIPIMHAHDVSKHIPREKNLPSVWKCYKRIGSRLRLEQLLCIFRALQTSRVLNISMNARWHMNQLWLVEFYAASSMLESSRIVDSLDGLSPWSKKHLKSAREIKYRFVKTLWVEDTFDIGNFHLFI